MKLVIPPKVQIGDRTIKIKFSDKVLDWQEHRATENTKEEIIRLHTGQSPIATFESLIHEALHIIEYLYLVEIEEKDIVIYSTGLSQFLQSMGIEPDFSLIEEEKL